MKVGDKVLDDLTRKEHIIVKITEDKFGNKGIWIDSDYLEGGRHPWEITEIQQDGEKDEKV